MAWPPRRRRSGRNTRRERTFALFGQTFLVLVIGIAVGFLIMSRFAPGRAESLRAGGADMVAPLWRVVQVPVETVAGVWNNAGAYLDSARRVKRLEAREALYRSRRAAYEEAFRENREMRALLRVTDPERERVGTFAVAGAASGVYASQAIIAGGVRHGVEPGQPVRSAAGLLGRTVEVGRHSARVMLVTDASSRVPVRVARTGLPALVIGTNKRLVDVDLTGPTSNDVQIGDRLVSSGDGGLFAPGIPVATVVDPAEDAVRALPAAVPTLSRYVIVERPYMRPVVPVPPIESELAPDEALPDPLPPAP